MADCVCARFLFLVIVGIRFTLYDTQRMVAIAKTSPRYDPVNESLGLYMNIVNIFIRYATRKPETCACLFRPSFIVFVVQDGTNHGQLQQAPPLNAHYF